VIFLLAGAVVSLAVAVFGAVLEKLDPLGLDTTTEMQNVWAEYAPASWPKANYGFRSEGNTWDYREAVFSGDMTNTGEPHSWPRPVQLVVKRWRAGWPLRSLVGIRVEGMTGGRLYSTHTLWLSDDFNIPYGPIWDALVLNVVLYATVLWLLIRGPFALRGLIRLTRGRCVKCGYPAGDSSVCTECGETLPTAVRRAGRSCSSTAPVRGP
jgi:hypothetical protein